LAKIVEELRAAHRGRSIDLFVPPIGIWGDPDRMEQVCSNLIGNAILHGDPSTPVMVRAHVDGSSVIVSIHNYGVPIPEEVLPKLFDPFRRGERESRTSKTTGLGLGLYISWEIVRGHQGSIAVDSSAERGTTFRVKLPIQPASSR